MHEMKVLGIVDLVIVLYLKLKQQKISLKSCQKKNIMTRLSQGSVFSFGRLFNMQIIDKMATDVLKVNMKQMSSFAMTVKKFCNQNSSNNAKYGQFLEEQNEAIIRQLGGMKNVIDMCLTHQKSTEYINLAQFTNLKQLFLDNEINIVCGVGDDKLETSRTKDVDCQEKSNSFRIEFTPFQHIMKYTFVLHDVALLFFFFKQLQ